MLLCKKRQEEGSRNEAESFPPTHGRPPPQTSGPQNSEPWRNEPNQIFTQLRKGQMFLHFTFQTVLSEETQSSQRNDAKEKHMCFNSTYFVQGTIILNNLLVLKRKKTKQNLRIKLKIFNNISTIPLLELKCVSKPIIF